MGTLNMVLSAIACAFLIWMLYRSIKHNPEAFTVDKFSKSLGTMGVLALVLMGVIALVIMGLKS